MIEYRLKEEFEAYKSDFELIREQIEKEIIRVESYKGEFYELTPYSYQRNGFSRGKLIKNIASIKSAKNLCIYSFNALNRIIEIKVGCSIVNQFYHTFLFYEENLIRSVLYNNSKQLMNVCHYYWENSKIKRMLLQGLYGSKEENYFYNNDVLTHIEIKQYDSEEKQGATLEHAFQYQENGELESIAKSFVGKDYSEIIYKVK